MVVDGQIYLETLLPTQINGNQLYDHRIFIVFMSFSSIYPWF